MPTHALKKLAIALLDLLTAERPRSDVQGVDARRLGWPVCTHTDLSKQADVHFLCKGSPESLSVLTGWFH